MWILSHLKLIYLYSYNNIVLIWHAPIRLIRIAALFSIISI